MKRNFTKFPKTRVMGARSSRQKANGNMYNGQQFDRLQMDEIREGLENGEDVSVYADPTNLTGWYLTQSEILQQGRRSRKRLQPGFAGW